MSNRLYIYLPIYLPNSKPVPTDWILARVKDTIPSLEPAIETDADGDSYVHLSGTYGDVFISESSEFDSMLELFVWQRWDIMFQTGGEFADDFRQTVAKLCHALGESEYWFTCEELMDNSPFFNVEPDECCRGIDDIRKVSMELDEYKKKDGYDFDQPFIHMTV